MAMSSSSRAPMIGDPDPMFDDCSNPKAGLVAMTGRHIGDLLSAKGVTWGWFQGGFRPTAQQERQGGLRRQIQEHPGQAGHGLQPPSRALPILPGDRQSPSSAAELGRDDRQDRSGEASIRPQRFLRRSGPGPPAGCSFVKAKKYQDAHAGSYSNPIDEQSHLSAYQCGGRNPPIGRTRRSSSPMTIPTAGTIMSCRRS